MQNIFIDVLPPWVETGLQPAFYDLESGTVLQQTARMYAKVRELTVAYNEFTASITTAFENFKDDVNEVVAEYIEKFTELKDFVDDYFDNLDVQDEINHKLDEMVEDGTLEGVFIGQSNNTIYVKNNTDISSIVSSLDDGETLVLQKGSYTCNNATVASDDVTIICEDGTTITTTKTAFSVTGDRFHMNGGKITGPAEWYPETSVDLYGVIEIDGKSTIENVTFYNISKIGIYAKDTIKCMNCDFIGNMPDEYYTSTSVNNQVYGLYIHAGNSYSETSRVINCKFTDLIEGIYYSDYNYPVTAYSVLVSECIFNNLYDHACYINGGKSGIVTNCIAHNSNHAITMMGQEHSITDNTIYLPVGDDNIEITGVSLREPVNCKIDGNTIYGYGVTNTAGILLQNLSGNPSPNTIIDSVIISNNIFNSTGLITPIRVGNTGQTASVNNLQISNNIFDCVNNSSKVFIEFQSSALTNCSISDNIFTLHELFGTGIYLIGGDCDITGNIFNIKGMYATQQVNQNLISGSFSGKVKANKVTLTDSSLTNINLQLVRCTATNLLRIEDNIMPTNGILLSNVGAFYDGRITLNNNVVGNNYCKGTFRTNATGGYSITNKNFFGGISTVIIKPSNQASAIYSNYYVTASNGSNTFNVFTTDVTTNIDLDYVIL